MPLNRFKCPHKDCDFIRETFKKVGVTCPTHLIPLEPMLGSPTALFLETVNPATNKKVTKDFQKILKARARNHSRDVIGDELIQINRMNGIVKKSLLNKKGERRTKLDDI